MSQDMRADGCGCDRRPAQDRRAFLRDVIGAGAGLFLTVGFTPAEASGLGLRFARGARSNGGATASYDPPPKDGVTVDEDNEIMLARVQGTVYAFSLSCPHQRTMLKWLGEDNRFQCPKHKSKYEPDGTFISGRATRNMDRHPVRLEGGKLVVDLDKTIESDKDPTGWAAAKASIG